MSQLSIDVVVLTNLLKSLVTKPEEVKITRQIDEMGVLLSIQVHPKIWVLLLVVTELWPRLLKL